MEFHDAILQAVIGDKVYIAQGVTDECLPSTFLPFRPDGLEYHPFCDDFGPMNLSSIFHFISRLNQEFELYPDLRIVYCVDPDRRSMVNAALLLGSYMVIMMNMPSSDVSACFDWLDESLVEQFRDATHTTADFRLTVDDCWAALEKGQALGYNRSGNLGRNQHPRVPSL